ncbi:MAG: hypothetical protein PHR53_05310 [Bacteroidales bacterium]|nr:hypothetical protein [Bacteroidales bacterium]
MKIAILRDNITDECSMDALDNLEEANFAEKCLSKKHITKHIPFVPDISSVINVLNDFQPDMVFNLVESICKTDSLSIVAVQLLETLNIPFTGNHIYAQVVTSNKMLTKELLHEKHIPTPSACFVANAEYILKAKTEHASMNLDDSCIMKFPSEKKLQQTLQKKAKQTGLEWMAEKYIDGREFNCAFLGNEILPPAEIRFHPDFLGHKILTYEAKWDETALSYQQSLRSFEVEPEIAQRLKEITETCRNAFHLKGYARVDYRMDGEGNLYVIDINTNPCISPDSGFVAMVEKHGLTHDQMFEKIIEDAFIS